MRRSILVLVIASLCIAPVWADRKKRPVAPETAPQPKPEVVPAGQGPRITVTPRPFPSEPEFPLTRELAYQEETVGLLPRTITKVYQVGDLVLVPLPLDATPVLRKKAKTFEKDLIEKITSKVEPKSWSKAGGEGKIDYFPLGLSLIVENTPNVQTAVAAFLESLRTINDRQVVMELLVVRVSDKWFDKFVLKDALQGSSPTKHLKASEKEQLLRSIGDDPTSQIMQSPRITCLTGQPGRVQVGDTELFVTNLTVDCVNGQLVFTPKTVGHFLGLDVTLEPVVAADCKSVRTTIKGSVTEHGVLPVPSTPLTSLINPVSDKGVRVAPPVPFTQFLQEPKIISRDFAATANLDDNATVLLYGGKATIEESVKQPIPVLVGVPLMAEFFKVQKKTTATNHMLMLVTTKIVSPEIVAASCAECARCDPKLAKLLSDYNRACKEGKTEDARRLAIECLVVDPTCFGKK